MKNFGFKILMISAVIAFMFSSPAYAESSLTDIFSTKAFQGSWEVLNKFNWIGQVLNFIISLFCLIGLAMVLIQRIVTLLYLSSKTLFDNVYEIKQESQGSAFFGMAGAVKSVWNGSKGMGFDALLTFFYSLLPNIKAYSDYNPENMSYNLNEDDSVLTYMLKTALPTVLLVFFLSIGFSGTLAQGYGTIVNGMAAAADRAVDVNLETYVNKVLDTGESYDFTLGSGDSSIGKLGEDIAKDIYRKVLSRMNILDTPTRLSVGSSVESWVYDTILGGSLNIEDQNSYSDRGLGYLLTLSSSDIANSTSLTTEADINALRFDVTVNTSPSSAVGMSVKMTELLTWSSGSGSNVGYSELADSLYMHIIIRKGKVNQADFFNIPEQ